MPGHLQPHGFGIGLGERTVNMPGHRSEVFGIPARQLHLVERIGPVNVVGAVQTGLLGEKFALNPGLQRSGNMPGKSRKHGRHPQRPFAFEDASLQCFLPVDPSLRQRATPAVDIRHTMPREVCGSGKVGADLLVGQAHPSPHTLPHGLLSRNGQRHIHSVERHPVDQTLPLRPTPPRHRVAERAIVQKKTPVAPCLGRQFPGNGRKAFGQRDPIMGKP